MYAVGPGRLLIAAVAHICRQRIGAVEGGVEVLLLLGNLVELQIGHTHLAHLVGLKAEGRIAVAVAVVVATLNDCRARVATCVGARCPVEVGGRGGIREHKVQVLAHHLQVGSLAAIHIVLHGQTLGQSCGYTGGVASVSLAAECVVGAILKALKRGVEVVVFQPRIRVCGQYILQELGCQPRHMGVGSTRHLGLVPRQQRVVGRIYGLVGDDVFVALGREVADGHSRKQQCTQNLFHSFLLLFCFLQILGELSHGAATVRDGVLLLRRHLGE